MEDFDPDLLDPVDPSSFMAASREATKAEQASRLPRERELGIPLDLTS